MDASAKHTHESGTTSPSKRTVSTGGHKRSDSQLTAITSFTEVSNISIVHPGPPFNSPEASVAGDVAVVSGLNADTIASRLANMPARFTSPPASQAGDTTSDEEHTLVRAGTKTSADSHTPQSTQKVEEFPEHSIWASVTEDDVSNSLKRLAMLAKDEQKKQPEKTVEDVYTTMLTKLIKESELEFKGLKED